MTIFWLGLLAIAVPGRTLAMTLRRDNDLHQSITKPSESYVGPSEAEEHFAEAYLKQFYGYKPTRRRRMAFDDEQRTGLCGKVKEMQRFFGLPPTGELTKETLAVMRRPRCGLSDVEAVGEMVRWKGGTLSYRIFSDSKFVPGPRVHKVFRAAWKLWANVVPIIFKKRSRREADIVISFHSGDHMDGAPFDGKGGILAHAFLPGHGIGGDVHFDADEEWSYNATGEGFNLYAVAVHEFGHALGLSHSSDPGAIMYPSYNLVPNSNLELSFQDVKDAQHMYGINPSFPLLSLKNPPPRTPDKCDADLSFDAVSTLQQETVFFKDRFMWRKHPKFDDSGITLIGSLWSDSIPPYLDAAYQNIEENVMLFFKGDQYWAMRQLDLVEGFPKNISELGLPSTVRTVHAALHFREGRYTVFFTGKECWRYDEELSKLDEISKPVEEEWPGIPTPPDAAVTYEGYVYFFKGNLHYKYDHNLKHVISTGPANELLECRREIDNEVL